MTAFEAAQARLRTVENQAKESLDESLVESPLDDPVSGDETVTDFTATEDVSGTVLRTDWSTLSTWEPTSDSIIRSDDRDITIRLKHLETITNIGSYSIKVIRGKVSICEFELSQRSRAQSVFAAATHALPTLQCTSIAGADIILASIASPLEQLGHLSPLYRYLGNPNVFSSRSGQQRMKTFKRPDFSQQSDFLRSTPPLIVSDDWRFHLNSITSLSSLSAAIAPQLIMISGSRYTGKSTFTILALNRLLNQHKPLAGRVGKRTGVLLLDLNYSKPHFTAPGQISLMEVLEPITAPGYIEQGSSSTRIVKAHYMSQRIAQEDPTHFAQTVADLLRCGRDHVGRSSKVPLIIDTAGYSSIYEQKEIIRTMQCVKPFRMFHFGSSKISPDLLFTAKDAARECKADFVDVSPAPLISTLRTERQLQDMQLLSYFHRGNSSSGEEVVSNSSLWRRRPLRVNYAGNTPGMIGILADSAFDNESTCTALDGSLLSVVKTKDPRFESMYHTPARSTSSEIPILLPETNQDSSPHPDPSLSEVVGLALVVGIDTVAGTIDLVLPTACEIALRAVSAENILLVHGGLPSPVWSLKEQPCMNRAAVEEKAQALDGLESVSGLAGAVTATDTPWLLDAPTFAKAFWGNIKLHHPEQLPT